MLDFVELQFQKTIYIYDEYSSAITSTAFIMLGQTANIIIGSRK